MGMERDVFLNKNEEGLGHVGGAAGRASEVMH